jgi:hypothetical protein
MLGRYLHIAYTRELNELIQNSDVVTGKFFFFSMYNQFLRNSHGQNVVYGVKSCWDFRRHVRLDR